MGVIKNIVAEAEKRYIKERNMRYFKSCLTDEALEEFNRNYKLIDELFYSNYDELVHYKWHLNSDNDRLFKENSEAYLIKTENGYVIDTTVNQSEEAIAAEKELLFHGSDLVENIFKYVVLYENFHTKNWETKPGTDRKTFEYVAQSLGYLKGKELEQKKDEPKKI